MKKTLRLILALCFLILGTANASTRIHPAADGPEIIEEELPAPVIAYAFKKDLSKVVSFDLNDPTVFTPVDRELSGQIFCGTGANGIFYFVYEDYGYFNLKRLTLASARLGGVNSDVKMSLLDMAYDSTTDVMYGISATEGVSSLHTVALTYQQEQFPKVADFKTEMLALGCDQAGQLYGLGKDGKLYKVSKTDAALTEVGVTGVTLGVKHAMEFDRTTGKLYLLSTTAKDYSILYAINDLASGAATRLHSYEEEGVCLVGFYIPLPSEKKTGNIKEMKDAGTSDLPYQVTGEVLVTGVRTLENSTVFYVEDASAAIAVNYTLSAKFPYQPGDKLKDLKGKLVVDGTVNSLVFESASKISGDNAVVPLVITIPELKKNARANDARFVKIENAIVELDGNEFYLTQQEESVKITATSKDGLALLSSLIGKKVTCAGNVTLDAETGNIILDVTSLVELPTPVIAYAFKKDLSKVVSFDLNNPTVFTPVDRELSGQIFCGTGVNGIFYFVYEDYGYFNLKRLTLASARLGGVNSDVKMSLLDMAYDYTTDVMYGISTTEGVSSLHTVALTYQQEQFPKVADFKTEMLALSCDNAGQLYGLGKDGKLYKVSKTDAALTEVGVTGVALGVKHAMEFDRTTGKLYLLSTTAKDYSILYAINDLTSGAATRLHSYEEEGVCLVGLYLPLPAEKRVGNIKEMKDAGTNELPYQVTGEVLVTGVRTLEKSTVFYVEDASAAIAVNYTLSAKFPYQPGDKLKDLKGKLVVNGTVNSLAFESASKVSSDNAVVPIILSIAEINAGYPANEAKFISIENAFVSQENELYVLMQDGNKVLTTGAESELQNKQGQTVVVTGHVESATNGVVMLSLDKVEGYVSLSVSREVNNFYCKNSIIVAESAGRIEIYDIAGRQVIASDEESVCVKGMKGIIIAKAIYANGEVKMSKFGIK